MLAPRDNHLDTAWGIAFQLLHGRLSLDDVAKQISDARTPALQARVDGLLRQMSFHREADNEARIARLLDRLAREADGRPRRFDQFQRLLGSELAGVVLTAHPTFSLSSAANEIALELMRDGMAGGRGGAGERARASGPAGGSAAPGGGGSAAGALRGGAAAVTVHRD